jgi:N6-L-threonylcarbamoyladenine synthase
VLVEVMANELASQVDDHQEYGGVFPTLAKRLHARNILPLCDNIFKNTKTNPVDRVSETDREKISDRLSRHPEVADMLINLIEEHGIPDVDTIAVTVGPGLSPALWVGVNVACSLALVADVSVTPVNHMRGHFYSATATGTPDGNFVLTDPELPTVGLLVSGGHTELVTQGKSDQLTKIGQTRDDAAGEAFDKIGRLLGLPYPAGPDVSGLAGKARDNMGNSDTETESMFTLPRPMIDSDNLDFSFAGLKTAARKQIENAQPMSDEEIIAFAYELETTIVDVLIAKTTEASRKTDANALLAGGGVVANTHLRNQLKKTANTHGCDLHICPLELATDNAIMIGIACWQKLKHDQAASVPAGNLHQLNIDDSLSIPYK